MKGTEWVSPGAHQSTASNVRYGTSEVRLSRLTEIGCPWFLFYFTSFQYSLKRANSGVGEHYVRASHDAFRST